MKIVDDCDYAFGRYRVVLIQTDRYNIDYRKKLRGGIKKGYIVFAMYKNDFYNYRYHSFGYRLFNRKIAFRVFNTIVAHIYNADQRAKDIMTLWNATGLGSSKDVNLKYYVNKDYMPTWADALRGVGILSPSTELK